MEKSNADILKDALCQIHFRSDFNIGGVWEAALNGLIAELEQAKRDALPCQVLDVLDAERRARARITSLENALASARVFVSMDTLPENVPDVSQRQEAVALLAAIDTLIP